jgi:hypothetical protein
VTWHALHPPLSYAPEKGNNVTTRMGIGSWGFSKGNKILNVTLSKTIETRADT